MGKNKHTIDNLNMVAIYEKALKVKAENEAFGLPFDMGPDLERYLKKKESGLLGTENVRVD